jgi:hypothetical protein
VEGATLTVLEWVAAVALVVGSSAVLWAVKLFDAAPSDRPRPTLVRRRADETSYRKAAKAA